MNNDKTAIPMIPITMPFFDEREERAVAEALRGGWVVQGPNVKEFEDRLAEMHRLKHAIAVSNCTSGLHLILAALGIGPGDEVVVPAYTFIATANAVEYTGATPVFCDIDEATCNVDAASMESKITGRTKALMPVHLFGLCADMDPIMETARQKKLVVVEDAACALAAQYKGRFAGSFGAAGAVSFHPRKIITTGEGGMILTGDDTLAELLRSLRDHGASACDLDRHEGKSSALLPEYRRVGYNYRMTDIQGALGVEQMKKSPDIIRKRRAFAARYDALLERIHWLIPVRAPEGSIHSYQAYVCRVTGEAPCDRNEIIERLKKQAIACRQGTHAVHIQEYYRKKHGLREQDFPQALNADRDILALPLYHRMSEADQDRVVAALGELH